MPSISSSPQEEVGQSHLSRRNLWSNRWVSRPLNAKAKSSSSVYPTTAYAVFASSTKEAFRSHKAEIQIPGAFSEQNLCWSAR